LVPKDFDAEAEGFEVVEPEEDGESSVDGGGRLSTSDREFFRREIRAAVREELDADEDDLEDDDLLTLAPAGDHYRPPENFLGSRAAQGIKPVTLSDIGPWVDRSTGSDPSLASRI
jgi:hypothetical protein